MAAVYVPVWAVRANIEGKTNEGEEVAVISKGAWFPGTFDSKVRSRRRTVG